MPELITYDPSNDPQAIELAEERDAESLRVGEEMEQAQNELLAGKYKSAQDLEQAYLELQKKLGSQDSNEEEVESELEDEPETDETVDFIGELDSEFTENGQFSEETMEKLASMDSKDLVDAYFRYRDTLDESPVAQVKELSDSEVNEVYNSVGGQEQYQQLTQWAADNLDQQSIDAFDSLVDTGNTAAINLALRGLMSAYQDSVGYEGEMIQGKAAQSTTGFRSQAEMVRAMTDSRYERDPAYRMEILEKLAQSDF